MFFYRYHKSNIEPFANNTIAASFDDSYSTYISPVDTDNFDFVSLDHMCALEVVLVISASEEAAYEYEIQFSKGKINLHLSKIKDAKVKDDGSLFLYEGGSISELAQRIKDVIKLKEDKAIKRCKAYSYKKVDLCICIQDGSLLDLHSFNLLLFDIEYTVFSNIFFITTSCFIRHNNEVGFEEYVRKTRD